MTAETPAVPASAARPTRRGLDGPLIRRQLRAVVALELARRFHRPRAWLPYLLTMAPVGLAMAFVVAGRTVQSDLRLPLAETVTAHSVLFQTFTLPVVVYLGCVALFSGLFRTELLQGTLHYYLLTPMRREVLLVGKWLSGLVVAVPLFALSTVLTVGLMYGAADVGPARAAVVPELMLRHGLGFAGTAAMATLGYGSVFLLVGLLARNPILPAAVVLGWESINFLLPPVLKQLSVIHHLNALNPVPVGEGPFALLADPAHPLRAAAVLVALSAAALVVAARRLRRLELDYGDD